jgi:hypothetical protein
VTLLQGLPEWLRENRALLLVAIFVVIPILRGLFEASTRARKQQQQQQHRGQRRPVEPSPAEDLEAVVRRNFEEMMRRRRAAVAEPAPPRAPPRPPAVPIAVSPEARRIDYDARPRREPTQTEPSSGDRPRAPPLVPRASAALPPMMSGAGLDDPTQLQKAPGGRRVMPWLAAARRSPRSLRRALVLQEVLGPPTSQRADR